MTLDGLSTDRVVELSALAKADGGLEVMRLRTCGVPVVGLTEVNLSGKVTGLVGGSFILATGEGFLSCIFFDAGTRFDDLAPGGLRDGLEVRVEGILLSTDAIDASKIASLRGRTGNDFDEIEIHGIVSHFASISDFRVAGRPVDASGAFLAPDDPGLCRDGVRVEVEGRLDWSGLLLAEQVKFGSSRVRIHAEVANDLDVDPGSGRLSLLGILIQTDSSTWVGDNRDHVEGFGLGDVAAGDFLEVSGLALSDGKVSATRLERRYRDDLRLKGPVGTIDENAGEFTILGVLIATDPSMRFEDDDGDFLAESEFYARLEPVVPEAKDPEDGDETRLQVPVRLGSHRGFAVMNRLGRIKGV